MNYLFSFFSKPLTLAIVVLFVASCSNAPKESSEAVQTEKSDTCIALDTAKIFAEYDKLETTQVNPNVSRKLSYLNDLMLVIVEFDNGPMAEPDPTHFHEAEQITYVAEGECLVIIGDKQKKLKQGDMFAVPSNVPHTVQSLTKKLRLIDAFNPIRQDFVK